MLAAALTGLVARHVADGAAGVVADGGVDEVRQDEGGQRERLAERQRVLPQHVATERQQHHVELKRDRRTEAHTRR